MQRNPKLSSIHPVHEGEDKDPTGEETQQDNDAIESMPTGAVEAQLCRREEERDVQSKCQKRVAS